MFLGLDSKFQRLKKEPDDKGVETKEDGGSQSADKTNSFKPSVKKPETPPLPRLSLVDKNTFDAPALYEATVPGMSLTAAQNGKRAQLRFNPQIPLTHVVHIATAAISDCFLHRPEDAPNTEFVGNVGSSKLLKELSSRLFDVVASELMFRGAVARVPNLESVYGPAPNPRDLDGLMNATVTLFASARASESGSDETLPPLQSRSLPPLPPLNSSHESTTKSDKSKKRPGALEALFSPESAGRILDGSVRGAGAGQSSGRLIQCVQSAASRDRNGSKHKSSVVDIAGSSTSARRYKIGRSAATVAASDARYTSSQNDKNGQRSKTSERAETLRQSQKMRGASEPRGLRPSVMKQDSFEDRFQGERRHPPTKSRILAPLHLGRSTGDVGSEYLRHNVGGSCKYDLSRGNRNERFGQELDSEFDSPRIPRPRTPLTRSPRQLTPPPRSPSNRGKYVVGNASPSNNTINGNVSSSSTSSSNFSARVNGSAFNVSSNSNTHNSSRITTNNSSFGNQDIKYKSVPAVGGKLNLAAIQQSASSTVNTSTSAAAWHKVLALLATDNQAACALEELFERAPGGFLDLDELALNLFNNGVPLKGPELRGFHADCDLNGNGTISLIQFLLAVMSRHNNVGPNNPNQM